MTKMQFELMRAAFVVWTALVMTPTMVSMQETWAQVFDPFTFGVRFCMWLVVAGCSVSSLRYGRESHDLAHVPLRA